MTSSRYCLLSFIGELHFQATKKKRTNFLPATLFSKGDHFRFLKKQKKKPFFSEIENSI